MAPSVITAKSNVHIPGTGINIPDPFPRIPGLPGWIPQPQDPLDPLRQIDNIGKAKKAVQDAGSVISFITNPTRVAEMVVGLILVAIGIDKMFNMNLSGKATKAAAYAAK